MQVAASCMRGKRILNDHSFLLKEKKVTKRLPSSLCISDCSQLRVLSQASIYNSTSSRLTVRSHLRVYQVRIFEYCRTNLAFQLITRIDTILNVMQMGDRYKMIRQLQKLIADCWQYTVFF